KGLPRAQHHAVGGVELAGAVVHHAEVAAARAARELLEHLEAKRREPALHVDHEIAARRAVAPREQHRRRAPWQARQLKTPERAAQLGKARPYRLPVARTRGIRDETLLVGLAPAAGHALGCVLRRFVPELA